MLFLLALVLSASVSNAQSAYFTTILSAIQAGQATPALQSTISNLVTTGGITVAEAQQLLQAFQAWLAEAAAAAAAAEEALAAQSEATSSVIPAGCAPTDAVAREKTPVIGGNLGYGPNQCSALPDALWGGSTVSDTVPDISGTYVNDNGMCPAVAAAGNQIRIEQRDEEIMFVGAGVVHHFKAEATDCPVTLDDVINACVGQPAGGTNCGVTAMATSDLDTNCWTIQSDVGSVTWCKTDSGVSRQITGMAVQTFTAVDTRRRKQ